METFPPPFCMPANISVLKECHIFPPLSHCFLVPVKAVDTIILPTCLFFFFPSSQQRIMTYFPSISFGASLALCVFLKNRWLMLFLVLFQSHLTVIITVALIHCQMKAVEELLLGSVSTNTFVCTPEISQVI